MPGTVTQAELRRRTLETMEDNLRISNAQGKDFVDSLVAVVTEAIEEGSKVALFGIVTLTPKYRAAKPKRKGVNPRTGEEQVFDARPASTTVGATVAKKIKDFAPATTSRAGKGLRDAAEARRAAAEKRAKQRERELAGAGKGRK
jgi:nucleoid DNA-binding protein